MEFHFDVSRSVYIVYTMLGDLCIYVVGKDEYEELACKYVKLYQNLSISVLSCIILLVSYWFQVSEVIYVITSAVKDVCGKPPTERLFLDKYGRICLCLDEIVWKVKERKK